jgi:hypothetical protein
MQSQVSSKPLGMPKQSNMDYERRILVVDGPNGMLQSLVLELLERDYSIHYANDIDEAQLLAGEERDLIGAVLLSSEIESTEIPDLARRFGIASSCFVAMGDRPSNIVIDELQRRGVRWHLWDDPSDQAIRFVLSSVLSERDPFELRFYPRVPLDMPGELRIGNAKADVRLHDVSLGGACIVGNSSASEGETGRLMFEIADGQIDLPIHVAWSTPDTGDGAQVSGIIFVEVDVETGNSIDALVDGIVGQHRISKSRAKAG